MLFFSGSWYSLNVSLSAWSMFFSSWQVSALKCPYLSLTLPPQLCILGPIAGSPSLPESPSSKSISTALTLAIIIIIIYPPIACLNMLKPYLSELQCRVSSLNDLLGDVPAYEVESKLCQSKLAEIMGSLSGNKETLRRYQKISNFVEKHCDVLDGMYTSDKVNIVVDELDTLGETAEALNKIEQLLPALETEDYLKNKDNFNNVGVLGTASKVKLAPGTNNIEVVKYDPTSLAALQAQERTEMNSIMELNYRMLNNLNEKLKLAFAAKQSK